MNAVSAPRERKPQSSLICLRRILGFPTVNSGFSFQATADTMFTSKPRQSEPWMQWLGKKSLTTSTGLGLTICQKRETITDRKALQDPFSLHDFGWNKRIKTGMQKFILNATEERFEKCWNKTNCKAILQNKDTIAESVHRREQVDAR